MAELRTLIIGVGNADRGDDGAGLAVVTLLRERSDHADGVRLIQHWGEASGLVEAMAGWDRVLIIDAAASCKAPGDHHVFDVSTTPLPSDLTETSSHGFGVAQAIELARALGSLPRDCRVYAIEGESFEAGAALSDRVQAAVGTVAEAIMQSLELAPA
ncbi:MAG: hydrogenase maturation protease [Alphaproteobacteria bacterium]